MSNRQSKRMQEREERAAEQRLEPAEAVPAGTAPKRERTRPGEFLREVRQELRKVAWPNRREVANYTTVVLIATAFLMAVVFGLDFVFGRLVFAIFGN